MKVKKFLLLDPKASDLTMIKEKDWTKICGNRLRWIMV